jgi:hypothetical protein
MNTKHTPGKWTLVKNTSASHSIPPYIIFEDTHSKNIATVIPWYADMEPEEVEANARLIAAAPELLAALKEIIANPRRVYNASVLYEIGLNLPLNNRLAPAADWYKGIISAVEKATVNL